MIFRDNCFGGCRIFYARRAFRYITEHPYKCELWNAHKQNLYIICKIADQIYNETTIKHYLKRSEFNE